MIKKLIIFSSLLLIGCQVSKENFDCQYAKGVGCRSITEVNGMINDGKLAVKDTKMTAVPIKSTVLNSDNIKVQRITEEHLRVWLAPHQDNQGHFHEAAVIHSVLKPGFWQTS